MGSPVDIGTITPLLVEHGNHGGVIIPLLSMVMTVPHQFNDIAHRLHLPHTGSFSICSHHVAVRWSSNLVSSLPSDCGGRHFEEKGH